MTDRERSRRVARRQQAGEPRELLGILQILTDDLGEARQCVEHTRTLTESERQEAERWGD